MTLLLVAGSPGFIVLVSDRRYTRIDNSTTVTDEGNKAIAVRSPTADFGIMFTGLATLDGEFTDAWIMARLRRAGAPKKGARACAEAIRQSAQDTFEGLFSPEDIAYPQTFVVAGFEKRSARPFIYVVTNRHSPEFSLVNPDRKFRTLRIEGVKFPYHQDGLVEALDPSAKAVIRSVARKTKSQLALADRLVREVRKAADHVRHGKYVGKTCMAMCIQDSGDTEAFYYGTGLKPHMFSPSLIDASFPGNIQVSMGGIEMGGGIGPFSMGNIDDQGGVNVQHRQTLPTPEIDQILKNAAGLASGGRLSDALSTVRQALERDAYHYSAICLEARILAYMEDSKRALDACDRAFQILPDHAASFYNRACVYALSNRPDEALADLDRAITAEPNCRAMAREDDDFANIRDAPRFKKLVGEEAPS